MCNWLTGKRRKRESICIQSIGLQTRLICLFLQSTKQTQVGKPTYASIKKIIQTMESIVMRNSYYRQVKRTRMTTRQINKSKIQLGKTLELKEIRNLRLLLKKLENIKECILIPRKYQKVKFQSSLILGILMAMISPVTLETKENVALAIPFQ